MMGMGVMELLVILLVIAAASTATIALIRANANRPTLPTAPLTPPELEGHIRDLVASGQKIYAVKLVREQTGLGLKAALAMVENVAGQRPRQALPSYDRPDLASRVRELKALGRTQQAIHLVCGETGMTEDEATTFVNSL